MWFWYFWGISFCLCFVINMICATVTKNKIKELYPDFKQKKITGLERFVNFSEAFILSAVPFINILITLGTIFTCTNSEVVEETKNKIEEDK